MSEKVDGFIFYASYYDGISDLPEEDQGELYRSIMDYVFSGKEPVLTGAKSMAFKFIRPTIDANIKRRINGRKGAEYGRLGGRPKEEKTPNTTPNITPSVTPNTTPNITPSVTPKDNIKDKIIKKKNNNNSLSVEGKTPAKKDSAAEAAAVRPQDVVDLYNGICRSLPKVAKITDERRRHINARLKEHPPEDFRRAFEKAEASDFLSGRAKDWQATFDWIIGSPDHFQRILEGVYDDKPKKDAVSTAGRLADALIQSADPEAVAAFEESMNGGLKTS